MNKILIPLLLGSSLCGQAYAEDISASTAARFITSYYKAIQKHDLATINRMIDDRVIIKVVWTEANPAQTFTLSKSDYLQQLKATWHFASKETYEMKNLSTTIVNGVAVVTLQDNQSRMLFGDKAGQLNDLKISLSGENGNPRITTISSKTAFL